MLTVSKYTMRNTNKYKTWIPFLQFYNISKKQDFKCKKLNKIPSMR